MATTTTVIKSPAEEMVERLELCIRLKGADHLEEVERDFEGARRLFAGLQWWPDVERGAVSAFAMARQEAARQKQQLDELERKHQLELERIRAKSQHITVIQQPNATAAIDNGLIDQQNVALGAMSVAHTSSSS